MKRIDATILAYILGIFVIIAWIYVDYTSLVTNIPGGVSHEKQR